MKILDKYLSKEFISFFVLGIVGFGIIMSGNFLFSLTDLFINKVPPLTLVLKLLWYNLPAILVLAFPAGMLLSTLLSLGRLAKDSEITAMRMGKISFYRIMFPFFILGILVSLLAYVTNEKIVPHTNHLSQNIIRRLILTQPLPLIQENIMFKGGPNYHFYIRRYNPETRTLNGVLIYEQTGNRYPQTITAETGRWRKNIWELQKGIIHKFEDSGFLDYELQFKSLKINVHFDLIEFFSEQRTPQEMNSSQLLRQIQLFKKGGIDVKSLATDFHFKFSIPFACLIVVLIGAPLSLLSSRGGSVLGIIFCLILVSLYQGMMSLTRSLGFIGILPPFLAAWFPNIIFGLVGVFLIWKVEH